MITKKSPSFGAKIFIAGPIEVIEQTCREVCLNVGLCVTVDPTKFIYTGGEEAGAVVGLINYPRFPCSPNELMDTAETLARKLLDTTFQHSILIQGPDESIWISKRESA